MVGFAGWYSHIRCLLSQFRRVLSLQLAHRLSETIRGRADRTCELACGLSQTVFPNGGSPGNTSGARSLRPMYLFESLVLLLKLLSICRKRLPCERTRNPSQ